MERSEKGDGLENEGDEERKEEEIMARRKRKAVQQRKIQIRRPRNKTRRKPRSRKVSQPKARNAPRKRRVVAGRGGTRNRAWTSSLYSIKGRKTGVRPTKINDLYATRFR